MYNVSPYHIFVRTPWYTAFTFAPTRVVSFIGPVHEFSSYYKANITTNPTSLNSETDKTKIARTGSNLLLWNWNAMLSLSGARKRNYPPRRRRYQHKRATQPPCNSIDDFSKTLLSTVLGVSNELIIKIFDASNLKKVICQLLSSFNNKPPSLLFQLDKHGYGIFHRLLRLPSEFVKLALPLLLPEFECVATQKDAWGNLPLHMALEYHTDSFEIIQALYHCSRAIIGNDRRDGVGRWPIHLAIVSFAPMNVLELLPEEESSHPLNDFGMSPLHCSLRVPRMKLQPANCWDAICFCMTRYETALKVQDNFGRLPLHVALESDVSNRILSHLMQTCGSWDVLGVADKEGRLPIHVALDMYRKERWLAEKEMERIALFPLAQWPSMLLHKDMLGRTPLHVGISRGISPRVVQTLLSAAPASVESIDCSGMLPFEAACARCSLSTIYQLIILDPGLLVGKIRR